MLPDIKSEPSLRRGEVKARFTYTPHYGEGWVNFTLQTPSLHLQCRSLAW